MSGFPEKDWFKPPHFAKQRLALDVKIPFKIAAKWRAERLRREAQLSSFFESAIWRREWDSNPQAV